MKDSGIEWIGEIPKHWNVLDLKFLCTKLVVGFVGPCEQHYTNENGIPMLRTTNIQNGSLDLTNLKYVTKEFHEQNKKSQLVENDLIIARHGESGSTALVHGLSNANCLNIVVARPESKKILPKYLQFVMNSITKTQLGFEKFGGVQGVVNTEDIGNVTIIFPANINEQQSVLKYLNKTTTDLDSLISKAKSQIQKLREYRQTIISAVITGKIDVRNGK